MSQDIAEYIGHEKFRRKSFVGENLSIISFKIRKVVCIISPKLKQKMKAFCLEMYTRNISSKYTHNI